MEEDYPSTRRKAARVKKGHRRWIAEKNDEQTFNSLGWQVSSGFDENYPQPHTGPPRRSEFPRFIQNSEPEYEKRLDDYDITKSKALSADPALIQHYIEIFKQIPVILVDAFLIRQKKLHQRQAYLNSIPGSVTEEDLFEAFSQLGDVEKVNFSNKKTRKLKNSKTTCIITFTEKDTAQKAILQGVHVLTPNSEGKKAAFRKKKSTLKKLFLKPSLYFSKTERKALQILRSIDPKSIPQTPTEAKKLVNTIFKGVVAKKQMKNKKDLAKSRMNEHEQFSDYRHDGRPIGRHWLKSDDRSHHTKPSTSQYFRSMKLLEIDALQKFHQIGNVRLNWELKPERRLIVEAEMERRSYPAFVGTERSLLNERNFF